MRTTLNIDDDIYEAARTLAETTGKSLGAIVTELARRGLQPRPQARGANDLPVFAVPGDAEVIPGNRASRLLDEEGLH